VIITLVVITLLSHFSISNVSANIEPGVIFSWLPGEEVQYADVRPGEHATVQFPGHIHVESFTGDDYQDVIIDLNGYTVNDWPVEVRPSSVQVDPGGTATFSVTVSVPSETSTYVSDTLTINGIARLYPGPGDNYKVEPIKGKIKINQFYRYTLHSEAEEWYTELGEESVQYLNVQNYGNGKDTFTIDIVNAAELDELGISFILSTHYFQLDSDAREYIQLNLDIPVDRNCIGDHKVTINVISTGREANEDYPTPKGRCFDLHITAGSGIINNIYAYNFECGIIILLISINGIFVFHQIRKKR
jgi:hypothetical protein